MSRVTTDMEERVRQLAALRSAFMAFKRTLNLIRTSTELSARVTPSGVPLLGALNRLGPQRITALAAEFGLDASTVSRQIDMLLRTGQVEKVRDPADGRALLVQLTPEGHSALHTHLDSVSQALGDLLDDWPDDDISTFSTLLGRFNDDVRARLTTASPEAPTPQEPQ